MKSHFSILLFTLLLTACHNSEPESDAYGNFSATEVLVTAQTPGIIIAKYISEGNNIDSDAYAYIIDTVQTHLKKQELRARQGAVLAKKANVNAQLAVLKEQENALTNERTRFQNLVNDGAAPKKQLDDIVNQLSLVQRQMEQVQTNFGVIEAEVASINVSIQQLADMLSRAYIKSPISGTVLETYFEQGEAVVAGRPLFKIAKLDTMELKAYFTARQLATIKLGDEVKVLTDNASGGLKEFKGIIRWISQQAEFTPKIIQTREERISLVYAAKICVINDGTIYMNMPGEVRLVSGIDE